jgi:hypothetical protein
VAFKQQQRSLTQRVATRCRGIKQQAAWDAWLEALGEQLGSSGHHCCRACTDVPSSCVRVQLLRHDA